MTGKLWLIVHPVTGVVIEVCASEQPHMSSGEEVPEGFSAYRVSYDEALISRRQLVERT